MHARFDKKTAQWNNSTKVFYLDPIHEEDSSKAISADRWEDFAIWGSKFYRNREPEAIAAPESGQPVSSNIRETFHLYYLQKKVFRFSFPCVSGSR